MGDTMTITTGGEFRQDSIRMGLAVTISTFGNHGMLFLMTGGTGYIMMLGRTCGKLGESIFMTCRTLIGGNIFRVNNGQRLMCFMTTVTISLDYSIAMRVMTGHTFRNLAMDIMTGGTSQGGMKTLVGNQLLPLLGMTSEAGLGNVFSQSQLKRLMGIGVTPKTILQGIMIFAVMAIITGRDDIHYPGRMPFMTFHTGNFCLMLATIGGNILGSFSMTFYTISIAKILISRRILRQDSHHHQHTAQTDETTNRPKPFFSTHFLSHCSDSGTPVKMPLVYLFLPQPKYSITCAPY